MKMMLGFFISFILICCSVGVTLLLMYFKEFLLDNGVSAFLTNFIIPLLNFIAAKFFSILYDTVSKMLNQYENHRSVTQFEDSLIYKVFTFNIFNNFNSFLVLAFVKIQTNRFGECIETTSNFNVLGNLGENQVCYNELITYVRTFFITGFLLNFLEIIIPALKDYFIGKEFLIKRKYPWGEIDHAIEKEWEIMDNFQLTVEIDGVLGEYLEITLLFSFISMFGQVFPLGFTLAFIILCSEMFIDKYKFLNQVRRPIPKGASDIGSWAVVMDLISYASIVINVSILTFTSGTVDLVLDKIFLSDNRTDEEFDNLKYLVFSVIICLLVLIKRMIMGLIPDVPRTTLEVLGRHQVIKHKMNFEGSGNRPFFRSAPLNAKYEDADLNLVVNTDLIFNKDAKKKDGKKKNAQNEKKRKLRLLFFNSIITFFAFFNFCRRLNEFKYSSLKNV